MVRLDPNSAQQKWASRTAAATQDAAAGADRVTESPGLGAVRNKQGYLNGVQAGVDKWERKLRAMSLSDWQTAFKTVGVPRIAAGVQAKQQKWGKFATQFFPHLEAGQAKVKAMPNDTFESRLQRMITMARHNREFRAQ